MKTRRHSARLLVALVSSMLTAAAPRLFAQPWSGTVRVALPLTLVDSLDGARFKIQVPANWNGTLLLYLQGSKSGTPPAEPLLTPPVLPGPEPPLADTLLSRGYALAASQVATSEWQQKAEAEDTFALTAYFRGRIGEPRRTVLLGTSLGGLAALRLIEEYPRSFDAALAACPPAAGTPARMDSMLDFSLAYDAVFGWPPAWGPIDDLTPGITFARDVNPVVPWPKPDGSNRAAWEFIRLITGLSTDAFWTTDPLQGAPGYMLNMVWATQQRETIESWAAGPIVQNFDRRYSLDAGAKAYLATLGLKADDLLEKMNARPQIGACAPCRDFAYRFATVRGALSKPVLTLHATGDGLAGVDNEGWYRDAVASRGASQLLAQAFVAGVGHCAFTATQYLTALAAVENWLDTGVRPDASSFPEAQGFDNRFVPPSWPW